MVRLHLYQHTSSIFVFIRSIKWLINAAINIIYQPSREPVTLPSKMLPSASSIKNLLKCFLKRGIKNIPGFTVDIFQCKMCMQLSTQPFFNFSAAFHLFTEYFLYTQCGWLFLHQVHAVFLWENTASSNSPFSRRRISDTKAELLHQHRQTGGHFRLCVSYERVMNRGRPGLLFMPGRCCTYSALWQPNGAFMNVHECSIVSRRRRWLKCKRTSVTRRMN